MRCCPHLWMCCSRVLRGSPMPRSRQALEVQGAAFRVTVPSKQQLGEWGRGGQGRGGVQKAWSRLVSAVTVSPSPNCSEELHQHCLRAITVPILGGCGGSQSTLQTSAHSAFPSEGTRIISFSLQTGKLRHKRQALPCLRSRGKSVAEAGIDPRHPDSQTSA